MKFAQAIKRSLHSVFLVGAFCVGVLIGVVLARFFSSPWLANVGWLILFSLVAIWLIFIKKAWALVLILIVGIFFGYVRGNIQMQSVNLAKNYVGLNATIKGKVDGDASLTKAGEVALYLKSVKINNKEVAGKYWVVLAGSEEVKIRRSDVVEVSGKLEPGFGSFAGSIFRAQLLGLKHESHGDIFIEIRDWFSQAIHNYLPKTEASLGAGYVLGENRALPTDFDEALRIVGLTHIVVASGYNLTILVRLARRLFVKISRYMAVMAGGFMVLFFVGITGLSPSMMRAGLVAGLSLLAWYYGRKIHPVMILLLAGAVSVIVNPDYAWGDVGWLLSFTAFIGVMFLAPLLQAYFFGDKKPGILRQIIGETISAQILTAPIIIFIFGTFSNVALLANIMVLPLVPLAMLLVFATGLAGALLSPLATLIAMPTQWLLGYMVGVVNVLSSVSWASFEVKLSFSEVVVIYVAIALIIGFLIKNTNLKFREVNIVR